MSPDTFLSRYGEHWLAFRREPMFRDLMDTIRSFDPARAMPAVSASDATDNAQHLLGRIAGFHLACNVMSALTPGPQHVSIEANYTNEETHTDA